MEQSHTTNTSKPENHKAFITLTNNETWKGNYGYKYIVGTSMYKHQTETTISSRPEAV